MRKLRVSRITRFRLPRSEKTNGWQREASAVIRELTDGRGVDFAFDVVGLPAVTRQAYDSLARRGTLVIVGIAPAGAETPLPMQSMMYEERTVTGSLYGSGSPRQDIEKLIELYRRGTLKLDELLTRTYPLEQINEAYAALERGEVARSVVTFS